MSVTNTSAVSTKSPTIRRILREAAEMANSPSPDYMAEPSESDLFEWHFTLKGPPNSVYTGGLYHGRIVLPPTYPLRPPSFRFATPSGRFEANREICLSISGHHEETWQPAWGIRTALVALRSFMETNASGQLGGVETTEEVRRRFAKESRVWRCPMCARSNETIMKECETRYQQTSIDASQETVPSELTMAWKDEIVSLEEPRNRLGLDTQPASSTEDAELAEGFVQTTTSQQIGRVATPTRIDSMNTPLVNGSSRGREAVTRELNHEALSADNGSQHGHHGVTSLWLDRAILALVVLLVALLLKVLFNL